MTYELVRQRDLVEPAIPSVCHLVSSAPRVTYFILWTPPAEAVPAARAEVKSVLPFMIAVMEMEMRMDVGRDVCLAEEEK